MKKILSLLLSIVILSSMIPAVSADSQKFSDVPQSHWAYQYISELVNRGVIAGYPDGTFRPDGTVTRAEWAKIMTLAAGIVPTDNGVYFKDVSAAHWGNIYINAAKDYLVAYTDGLYRPDQAAVREDVTVSMVKLKGYSIEGANTYILTKFIDINSISENLKPYVAVAVEKELVNGFADGTFKGQSTLTRAEAATLLWRAFQYGNDNKTVINATNPPMSTPNTSYKNPKHTPAPTPTLTPTPIPTPTPVPTPIPTPTRVPTPTAEPEYNNDDDDYDDDDYDDYDDADDYDDYDDSYKPKKTKEPEETPRATKKPYKISTVVKVKDGLSSNYIYDGDTVNDTDIIYYYTSSKVYSIDLWGGRTSVLLDTNKDLKGIDNDEATLVNFSISNVCFDSDEKLLYVTGRYEKKNSINKNVDTEYMYILDGDDIIEELSSSEAKEKFGSDKYDIYRNKSRVSAIEDYVEADGKVYSYEWNRYYSFYGDVSLKEYDYIDTDTVWTTPSEQRFAGMTDNRVITIDSSGIVHFYNFYGKEVKTIKNDEYEVTDKTQLSFDKIGATNYSKSSSIYSRLIITDDDEIIFYDSSANAFRMISENY